MMRHINRLLKSKLNEIKMVFLLNFKSKYKTRGNSDIFNRVN